MCVEQREHQPFDLEQSLDSERPRLARLCAYLTGDPTAADDLAQETLVEAWRNAHKLHDPSGCTTWLSAFARNVCLRWGRQQGRLPKQLLSLDATDFDAITDATAIAHADPFDLEVELERNELATLLDRAMALLPADTRDALVSHYVAESPLAEVAGRLGMSEGTIAVRLHRGKLALRRILTTQFQEEARSFGLIPSDVLWQHTRMWCPMCGDAYLLGHLDASDGVLFLRCPRCDEGEQTGHFNHSEGLRQQINGAKGFKTAYSRLMVWAEGYYQPGLERGSASCTACGKPVQPRVLTHQGQYVIDASCPACRGTNLTGITGVVLSHERGRNFWRQHPRLRATPVQHIEVEGRPTLSIGLVSVTDSARLDFLLDRRTFRALRVVGTPS